MNLRTYTLAVSLAAIIGLLVTIAPLIRDVLEYRSPAPQVVEPHELNSLEAFVIAKEKNQRIVQAMIEDRGEWNATWGQQWQTMYEAARAQHLENVRQQVESIRTKAAHNIAAYGTLCGLCILLLPTHLLWVRRLVLSHTPLDRPRAKYSPANPVGMTCL
jgi:hypothetical protein